MMSALVYLIIYAGKCGTANSILTVIIVNGKYGITGFVTNLFLSVSGYTPNRICPLILICIAYIKFLL